MAVNSITTLNSDISIYLSIYVALDLVDFNDQVDLAYICVMLFCYKGTLQKKIGYF